MLEYQERVVKEKEELDIKIEKLKKFLDSKNTLTKIECSLMERQLRVMNSYSYVLSERITLFNKEQ